MTNEPNQRPWRFEDDQYTPAIVDANGVVVAFSTSPDNRKVATDNARIIVYAVNEHDKLKAECDRLRTAYADLWRAVKRIESDSRLSLGAGPEVVSCALHSVRTYASSAILAAEKKGFAP